MARTRTEIQLEIVINDLKQMVEETAINGEYVTASLIESIQEFVDDYKDDMDEKTLNFFHMLCNRMMKMVSV